MTQVMIKPPRLKRGDTIGIISPSQSILVEDEQKEGFEYGIKRLKGLGFKVKVSKHAKGKYFYSSGTPEERAEDLHNMFKDPEVKAILMSIGGNTANELLPLLDYELIKNNPKIFLGMSDGTTLLSPITDKTGLVTFYGPDLIYSFGIQKNTEKFDEQMFNCVMGGKAEYKRLGNLTDDKGQPIPSEWENIRSGQSKGRLVGGYLEIVVDLIGAKYLNVRDNSILFLESMETPDTIHLRLQYLKLMGVFDNIKGLILGYFPNAKDDMRYYRPIGDIILELTKDKNFPILQINELGHYVKNYTFPSGIEIELDAENKTIIALEDCVS
ncbi:MAG: LD-carboxypeptidase [Candidatus Daviesbacteria bacterium]|nr:LD-carboxypeptidase [Candidatus Daviesbacteria bacterium]